MPGSRTPRDGTSLIILKSSAVVRAPTNQEVAMKIIDMPIGDVIPYKNNPRRNDAAVKPVMESLKEFGWKQPIVIDKDNVIVCGHTRLRAAKRLKMKTIPCVMADDLTPEQIKAFRLADNKTAEFASWDMDMLNSELLDIKGIDMGDFGFDMPEPEPEEDAFDVDAAHEAAKQNTITTPGTLYQLGNHRLLCGDSTNRTDVARLLGGQMVDMVFTDPPYNVAYQGGTKDKLTIKNDSMSEAEFKNFLDAVFDNYFAAMKPGASFYVCYASRSAVEFRQAIVDAGLLLKQDLVWCKNTFTLGRQDYQWQHEPILYGWKPGAKHRFLAVVSCQRLSQTTIRWRLATMPMGISSSTSASGLRLFACVPTT